MGWRRLGYRDVAVFVCLFVCCVQSSAAKPNQPHPRAGALSPAEARRIVSNLLFIWLCKQNWMTRFTSGSRNKQDEPSIQRQPPGSPEAAEQEEMSLFLFPSISYLSHFAPSSHSSTLTPRGELDSPISINMHVCGVWEETGGSLLKTSMQTQRRSAEDLVVRQQR